MIRYFLLIILCGFYLHEASIIGVSELEWVEYKQKYGKTYASQEEDNRRKLIFVQSQKFVDDFNADEAKVSGFTIGLNQFSDKTRQEYLALTWKREEVREETQYVNSPEAQASLERILTSDNTSDVPDHVDWREIEGRVTRVGNQGECAGGYAFAAAGVLEGQEKIIKGDKSNLIELSKQMIIDCIVLAAGCSGEEPHRALGIVSQLGGIMSEEDYPFTVMHKEWGICRYKREKSVFFTTGVVFLPPHDEDLLKRAVANFGPVVVSLYASSRYFSSYKSGIFNDQSCRHALNDIDHYALVVGYGTDPTGGDYWIIKNSMGEDWGENGYMRLARNRNNLCGVATYSIIPDFRNFTGQLEL